MADNLVQLSDDELVKQLSETIVGLGGAYLRHRMGRLENSSILKRERRTVARLKGELRRREIAGGLPKGSLTSRRVAVAPVSTEKAAGDGFLQSILDQPAQNG